MPDLIDAIDERIAAKTGEVLVEGIIVSVAPRYIRIKLTGSSRTVTAFYDSGMSLEAGKRAFITWSRQQARYVVLAAIDAPGSQSATGQRDPSDYQLAPPSNVAAVALPNAILVKWDDPIVQVLAYEIQSNSSATDVGATTELVTRGTFLKDATVQTYFRVRSVTTNYRYSSWSDWVNATPQALATSLISLTDVNILTPSDGDIPMWDSATSKWIAGMAGMFSGTATDVPYTPVDPSDWSGAPTNVGEALDELAATGGGGGANTALSNLSSVAINTSLVSDTDSTDDLGSTSAYWRNGYIDTLYLTEQSAPSTPATDKGVLYPKTDGKLYWLNDTGTEYDLTSTASGGALATVQAWTELGSNAASLSKTSISGSYDYLEIILNLRTDRAGQKLDDVIVSLNSDTTAGNYRSTGHYITGANATGVQTYRGVTVGGFAVYFGANGAGATSNYFAAITMRIYNYASAVPYKTMRYDGYVDGSGALDSDIGILNGGGVWLSTSAITGVTIKPRYGSNFVAGSSWGIYAR